MTPIVYVCQADDETQAGEIHRLVWNQDIAPFLIVVTPQTIRLYSGFLYEHEASGEVERPRVPWNPSHGAGL